MIRSANSLIIIAGIFLSISSEGSYAQSAKSCMQKERYSDAVERCADISPEDVIALGTLRVVDAHHQGGRRVILHDETRGDIDLLLTPSLIQALDESPAESFEVEGEITNGRMTVKNLRPIE